MYKLTDITALIINYRTLALTTQCLESFNRFYPQVSLLIIDNGSQDESTFYIRELSAQNPMISAFFNQFNTNHGPALHQGMQSISTPMVLTLDSDCQAIKSGFLEGMLSNFNDPKTYAVGSRVYLDRLGYEIPSGRAYNCTYIQPFCMLIDRCKYKDLKPFQHHGSPGLQNMQQAVKKGFRLVDFPIQDYVHHIGKGTCSRYGYNLGARHKVENIIYRLDQIISDWS
jgi:glycosyltransferase involved in cell wall biosynthesis